MTVVSRKPIISGKNHSIVLKIIPVSTEGSERFCRYLVSVIFI